MSDLQASGAESRIKVEEQEHSERRSKPRLTPLVQPAKLICAGQEYFCIVHDASESGMKIKHFGHLPDQSTFVVQLTNDEQIPVSVVWSDGAMAGVRFDSAFDIARIVSLARGDHPRRPLRINAKFMARLGWQDEQVPVEVTNISTQGARVTSQHPFAIDQLLCLTTLFLPPTYAKVRWRRKGEIGLVFETTLAFEELARVLADINAINAHAEPPRQ